MDPTQRQVYFLSNGTAITAETLGMSLLAQFPDHPFQTHTVPFVDTLEKAHAFANEINRDFDASGQLPSLSAPWVTRTWSKSSSSAKPW